MKPHGDYKIELISNVVHVFPCGGFNEYGIRKLHEDIASIVPVNTPWALFEHPYNISGLTPEGIDEIVMCYQNLSKLNCIVVALEISSTWEAVFEKSILGKVGIPVYLSEDSKELEKIIQNKLNNYV